MREEKKLSLDDVSIESPGSVVADLDREHTTSSVSIPPLLERHRYSISERSSDCSGSIPYCRKCKDIDSTHHEIDHGDMVASTVTSFETPGAKNGDRIHNLFFETNINIISN